MYTWGSSLILRIAWLPLQIFSHIWLSVFLWEALDLRFQQDFIFHCKLFSLFFPCYVSFSKRKVQKHSCLQCSGWLEEANFYKSSSEFQSPSLISIVTQRVVLQVNLSLTNLDLEKNRLEGSPPCFAFSPLCLDKKKTEENGEASFLFSSLLLSGKVHTEKMFFPTCADVDLGYIGNKL